MIGRWQSQQVFPIVLLGLLAALSFWLARTVEMPEPRLDGKLRHDPDAFVDHFQVRRLDAEGALQYRLTAPRMEHFPDDDSSLLSQPKLEYFRDRAPSMTLSGKNGYVAAKGETVFFWDDVMAIRAATAERTEMVARMPDLTVQPDEGIAFTDSPVEISQGQSWIKGVGMHLNNNTSVLTLKSQVTGTYYRPKAPQ
jgi:lipopolysaccharide export system protein LptC